MKVASFFAALAVLAADVYALFDGDNIEQLTSANWKEMVENDDENAWVVAFYADWCPYCKTFSDEYNNALADPQLADKRIRFGAVDVMANRDLTSKFGIKRSPSVKVFGPDRSAPEDYLGQRKAADLVTHCNGFCNTHNYIRAPEWSDAQYHYNIDEVVSQIAAAHDARVAEANKQHEWEIVQLQEGIGATLQEIDSEMQARLNALRTERNNAFQGAYDDLDVTIADARAAHAENISALDDEAVNVIESIIAHHKNDKELTEFIDSLELDWFNIHWHAGNRRAKKAAAAA